MDGGESIVVWCGDQDSDSGGVIVRESGVVEGGATVRVSTFEAPWDIVGGWVGVECGGGVRDVGRCLSGRMVVVMFCRATLCICWRSRLLVTNAVG